MPIVLAINADREVRLCGAGSVDHRPGGQERTLLAGAVTTGVAPTAGVAAIMGSFRSHRRVATPAHRAHVADRGPRPRGWRDHRRRSQGSSCTWSRGFPGPNRFCGHDRWRVAGLHVISHLVHRYRTSQVQVAAHSPVKRARNALDASSNRCACPEPVVDLGSDASTAVPAPPSSPCSVPVVHLSESRDRSP